MAGLVLAVALAAAPGASLASEADAFENKVPPISGQLYPTARRFELEPFAAFSVNDPFYTKIFFGAKAGYHLSAQWYLGAMFSTGFTSPTGSTNICTASGGCTGATDAQLYQLPGLIKWTAAVEAGWTPFYGKLNVVSDLPVHFDLSIYGGLDWVSFQQAVTSGEAATLVAAGQKPGTDSSVGGHLALGLRFFVARFVAVRFEIRDVLYSAYVGNLQERQLQNQIWLDLGVSFFFPTAPRVSP